MRTPHSNKFITRRTPLATAIATCLALSAIPSQAATITVTTNADAGTPSSCNLRQAVTTANTNAAVGGCLLAIGPTPDEVVFTGGLGTIVLTAQININEELVISAASLGTANPVTIDGDGAGNTGIRRVFGMTVDEPLTLNNLVVTNGLTTGNTTTGLNCASDVTTFARGGAICAEGDITLIDTTVSNSSTAGSNAEGGGFFAYGNATLTNSTVSGNSTAGSNAYGGGFFAGVNSTMTNSTVSGNSTAGNSASGGGFFVNSLALLTNSTVSGNSTAGYGAYGGGFYAVRATLANSTVSGNSTTGDGAFGGGIASLDNATLTSSVVSGNSILNVTTRGGGAGLVGAGLTRLINSTVSGNRGVGNNLIGGGVLSLNGRIELTNSTVSGNSLEGPRAKGGGIEVYLTAPLLGTSTLSNSTVSGNSVTGSDAVGGGVAATGSMSIELKNSTVSGNTAAGLGAVGAGGIVMSSEGRLTLVSTILAGNGANNADSRYLITATNSLFGDDAVELTPDVSNILDNTPGVSVLADNNCAIPAGVPASAACVQTHALLAGSLALNAGSNPDALLFDERGTGHPRVLDGQADIGAFEGLLASVAGAPIPALNVWLLGLLGLMLGFVARIKGRFS